MTDEAWNRFQALVETGAKFADYPDDIRLAILRLKYLGIDVSQPVHEDAFVMAYHAVETYAARGRDDAWIADAEAGAISPYFDERSERYVKHVPRTAIKAAVVPQDERKYAEG